MCMSEQENRERIGSAIEMFVEFLTRYGARSDAIRMAKHRKALYERNTAKNLLLRIKNDADRVYQKVRQQTRQGRCLPGSDEQDTLKRLGDAFRALNDALYPDEFVGNEMDVTDFAGSESITAKLVGYVGKPENVRSIFESSVRLVLSYGKAAISEHFEAALEHLASALRERTTKAALIKTYTDLAKEFGAKPCSLIIEGFGWILADDEARANEGLAEIWPKETTPEERRCTVNVFWIRDPLERTGNPETLWIVEEHRAYKIAKIEKRD